MHGVILDSKTIGKDVDLGPITSLLDSWDVFDLTDSSETNQRIFDADVVLTNKVKIDKSNLKAAKKTQVCKRACDWDRPHRPERSVQERCADQQRQRVVHSLCYPTYCGTFTLPDQ